MSIDVSFAWRVLSVMANQVYEYTREEARFGEVDILCTPFGSTGSFALFDGMTISALARSQV